MKRNRSYFSDDHGYVCDCRPSTEPYEMLCWCCQQVKEDMDDETMESTDERGEGEEE